MSSIFDTEVREERNRLPGVAISAHKLMQELMWASEGVLPASITVGHRPDVETSMWWTVRWGNGRFASATTLELALFRAAVAQRREMKEKS